MTDPVSDFLTRLRNAAQAQHEHVIMPSSKLKRELARILVEQGYITGYEVEPPSAGKPGERITVTLKYTDDRKPVISGLRRISRRFSNPLVTPSTMLATSERVRP